MAATVEERQMWNRRQFAALSLSGALAPPLEARPALKIGHRQANMTGTLGPAVFDLARRIVGLDGVELQVQFQGTTLWDRDTLLPYKHAAARTSLAIPSLAGVWAKGTSLMDPATNEETLLKSIRAAEALQAGVILVAAFGKNCPAMDREESYGPVVEMLRRVAGAASDAGVTLGLETSLSPADDKKLVDLVARPSVKVYYDADNCERYGHSGQAVPGYEAFGLSRLAQLHLKNDDRLLEEAGRVDWTAALRAVRHIGYGGWLVLESSHSGPEQCIQATERNIAFIRRQGL